MSLLSRLLGNRRRTIALEEQVRERMHAGDLAAARALVEKALALAPREAAIHHLSGRVALREGRLDVAVAHLQTAAAADDRSPKIRYDFAEALRLSGRPAEALDAYQAVLRQLPDQPEALLGLAEALVDVGDLEAARATLKRARCALGLQPPGHGLGGPSGLGELAEGLQERAIGLQERASGLQERASALSARLQPTAVTAG